MEGSILSYNKKGHGRANTEKGPIDVPATAIGDEVELHYIRRKKAQLLEILKPSSDRIEPRCLDANSCGGCAWQHITMEAQLREKQQRIETLFPDQFVQPITPCEKPFHYRNKMEFTFSQNKEGEKFLGLIKTGSRHVINLNECHLISPWMNEMLNTVRTWWQNTSLEAYRPMRDEGTLQVLTLREGIRTGEGMVNLQVSANSHYSMSHSLIESFKNLTGPASTYLTLRKIAKGTPTQLFEMHLSGPESLREELHIDRPYKFNISPQSFFQPNTLGTEVLYKTLINLANFKKTDRVLDLYCGIGSIGLCLASQVEKVIGVELNKGSVLDGRENLALNNIKNMELFHSDAEAYRLDPNIDVTIIDPPRAGLGTLTPTSPKVVYISCNPATQATDIERLQTHGYQIKAIQPVDQFPHTPHIENIIILEA